MWQDGQRPGKRVFAKSDDPDFVYTVVDTSALAERGPGRLAERE